jgi:modification methylase
MIQTETVWFGDCVTVMETFPDKCVDLIFADPPYNLTLRQPLYRPEGGEYKGVKEDWDKFEDLYSYVEFTRDWLRQAKRILKDDGAIWISGTYHNIFIVGYQLLASNWFILNDVTWIKSNPTPNFTGARFCASTETLIWATKKQGVKYTFNYHEMKELNDGKQMRADWYIGVCRGKERLKVDGETAHPTQKPEALLERIILATSNPGDIILDPFFGTGTTGAVADRLGREWVGIDNKIEYVDMAYDRITEQRYGD